MDPPPPSMGDAHQQQQQRSSGYDELSGDRPRLSRDLRRPWLVESSSSSSSSNSTNNNISAQSNVITDPLASTTYQPPAGGPLQLSRAGPSPHTTQAPTGIAAPGAVSITNAAASSSTYASSARDSSVASTAEAYFARPLIREPPAQAQRAIHHHHHHHPAPLPSYPPPRLQNQSLSSMTMPLLSPVAVTQAFFGASSSASSSQSPRFPPRSLSGGDGGFVTSPKYQTSASHIYGLLDAERYDDAVSSAKAHREGVAGVELQQRNPMIFGMTAAREEQSDIDATTTVTTAAVEVVDGDASSSASKQPPKKRQRLPKTDEVEEPAKKSRGRPRLAATDESAADRRRTQIRLAQRAYRQRKETTITELEKKVQDLRGNQDGINNDVIRLYELAQQSGLLQREPEFAKQFQNVAHRLSSLTSIPLLSSPKGEEDGDTASPDRISSNSHDSSAVTDAGSRLSIGSTTAGSSTTISRTTSTSEPLQQWNYHFPQASGNNTNTPGFSQRASNLEVLSLATPDNASFGFDIDGDWLDALQTEVAIDPPTYPMTINEPLAPVATYAFNEQTFARRLHRIAIERAYQLITSANPDPRRLNRAFGFCLNFHSKEKIIARLHSVIMSDHRDDLSRWNQPFINVGGSGTHYPLDPFVDPSAVPKFQTGQSMGPFGPEVVSARDNLLNDQMRVTMAGYEGDFFDPSDVEGYLRSLGIFIPPNATQALIRRDVALRYSNNSSAMASQRSFTPQTPQSPHSRQTQASQSTGTTGFLHESGMRQSRDNNLGESHSQMLPTTTAFDVWEMPAIAGQKEGNASLSMSFSTYGMPATAGQSGGNSSGHASQPMEDTVTISVDRLLGEILKYTICLGRSPGYKQGDLDKAVGTIMRAALSE